MSEIDAAPAGCACGVRPGDGSRAVAVDPAIKQLVTNRLKRIEGQIRGTRKMVQEERYCSDVLTQVASVQEAVRAVGREALLHHLRHCATAAIRSGDVAQAETVYREILETAFRSR